MATCRVSLLPILVLCVASAAGAAQPAVGFVVMRAPVAKLGPEARAAWKLAAARHTATLVVAAPAGRFTDANGQPISLDGFGVLWFHQGDSSNPTDLIHDSKGLDALRRYVVAGRGLFLSGAALAMSHSLRAEPVRARVGGPGNDRVAAGLVPVVPKHPIFRRLTKVGNLVQISDRGYPAFADFHGSGAPSRGMLLARTPGGSENPLAEYQVGKGRIVVMGWRLPHYSHKANPYRPNLERLTGNILAYLANATSWQKVVVKPRRPRRRPGLKDHSAPKLSDDQVAALSLAIRDLTDTFGARYPNGSDYLARLTALKKAHDALSKGTPDKSAKAQLARLDRDYQALRREALLANPLLDFDRILLVKRSERSPRLGLMNNWQSNSSLPRRGFDDELSVLSGFRSDPDGGTLTTLFKPTGGRFVGDVDLHWDATRMLFSMPGANGRWQIHEINTDGTGLRELPLITEPDVDNYDACYLPGPPSRERRDTASAGEVGGDILFTSTAPFVGVPCVTGSSHVSNIYRRYADGSIRRLTFEQDHDWCPTVMPNGRVLYLRWEYSDIPHYVSRILFHMNPDGTAQMEYYGSNSYWPNSMFYARPIPGHPTKFVAIVGGHHDVPRMGELVLFDVARGRHEADGVVQRIPGRGQKVEPTIRDGLVRASWPKFLHPWPLSDKYFLVAAKPTPHSRWGIYLADTFDNLILIREEPWVALFEPIPLRPTPQPPVIADKTDRRRSDATVYLADVYAGRGLRGVPRGTVKKLRLFTYQFAYHGMGGQSNRVGLDGPWDIKRIVGTVPVEADGSACFRMPANTPISIQPLDAEGKALQIMRSWMTAMPGEVLSCVGCHERQNTAVHNPDALALRKPPAAITPWYGPTRGFAFKREVQPVLDHHCVRCHNGTPRADGKVIPNFATRPEVHPQARSKGYNRGTKFSPSYIALRSYVRAHTIESDIHLLSPAEFHADTTRLVQRLRKDHHGVVLEPEAWDRLITWIDLNAPYHGTWHEIVGMKKVAHQRDRRREMNRRYANVDEDPEAVHPISYKPQATSPKPHIANHKSQITNPKCPGWPFDAAEARRRQATLGAVTRTVDLGDDVKLELVRIPAGQFVMGGTHGHADEQPLSRVKIARDFWMGRVEVTNEQFARFDPTHDSRIEHGDFLQFSTTERGYPVNSADQPVCRVTWHQATAFCRWLSDATGNHFALPTEAQWEWACRAGAATPMAYGALDADFAKLANLADHSLRFVDTFGWGLPSGAVPPWRPAITLVNDGHRVSAPVGSFAPNPWGLYDMHGNVAEWTRSALRAYPYRADDGRNDPVARGRKVVRGGSWYDRPARARSAFRQSYPPWQPVYDVGFRVICTPRPTLTRR